MNLFAKVPFVSKGKIDSFAVVNLKTSGMRYSNEYEITVSGDQAKVTLYTYGCLQDGSYGRKERESELIGLTEAIDKLNECHVMNWDGFHGSHPKGVKDGTMFSLKAKVNGGKEISANGSQNFPAGYRELSNWFYHLFH